MMEEKKLSVSGLRLVVTEFNKRAITLYKSYGFVKINDVEYKNSKTTFFVMERTL